MSFYQKLQDETVKERKILMESALVRTALAGKLSLQSYVEFLCQAYHHVKHTVPLLMACGAQLPQEKEWLREAIAEYIEEEYGHQEWVLNDIEACGFDKEEVRRARPSVETELMVSYAYDIINRINPAGFFGMVQVLEGTSVAAATQAAKAIQASLGLPNQAFSYLISHGDLDQDHVKFFASLMDKITDPRDQEQIIHCARVFYKLYGDIFRSLTITNTDNQRIEEMAA